MDDIRFSYPRLQSPAFLVLSEDKEGCVMLYQTKRRGFKHYVIGQLQQVAKRFYDIHVTITVIEEELIDRKTHVKFRLDFDNSPYVPKYAPKLHSGNQNFSSITGDTFLKVFPFCIVFNSQLVIRMVGDSMSALLKDNTLIGSTLREKFHIRRPLIPCIWTKILQFGRVIFEVEYLFNNDPDELDARLMEHDNSEPEKAADHRILLRGQMKYLQDWNMIAFLCTPLLCDLRDLQQAGLYINDLNLFDMSRDMVMAGWQHASQLERSIEEQREKTEKITENMSTLETLMTKSDSLLYSMIPKSVAGKLKSGEDPVSTCEIFDNVTIMFNYMVGFGEVCSSATPMEIVEIINNVFSLFDQIIDSYDVFKVETLGDAVYMVAGGVPDRNPNHAINVAGLALELQLKAKTLTEPWSNKYKLNTRIGMHTGSVVGGVVGRRMPQYCLFGDTVNTASRMQTYSLPGRIHISEPCQECLKESSFVTIVRGTVNVKGKGEMRTFWLAGKEGEESTKQFCEEIKQERSQSVRKYSLTKEMKLYFRSRPTTRGSYDNAMDLHAMHASTSYAQMPAYFGGMKSNRSASSVSLLQQTDDESTGEVKTGDRLIVKGSPRSSFSRLNEYRKATQEISEQLSPTEQEYNGSDKLDIHFELDEGDTDNITAPTGVNAELKGEKSEPGLQTKYDIPEITELDKQSSKENSGDKDNSHHEKENRLTLGKFKLSLPKMSDLFQYITPKDRTKDKEMHDKSCYKDVKKEDNEEVDVTKGPLEETFKINVVIGSDASLDKYDSDTVEQTHEKDIKKRIGSLNNNNNDSASENRSFNENSLEGDTLLFDKSAECPQFSNIISSFKCKSMQYDDNTHKNNISSESFHYAENELVPHSRYYDSNELQKKTQKETVSEKSDRSLNNLRSSYASVSGETIRNGFLTKPESFTRLLSVNNSENTPESDENVKLEILSCPFFSCIANSDAAARRELNSENIRKCKSDQGCINDNRETSFKDQNSNRSSRCNKDQSKGDSHFQSTDMYESQKESIQEHKNVCDSLVIDCPEDKLKLLEKGVKYAWGLENDNVQHVVNQGKSGECWENNNGTCSINGQIDANFKKNNMIHNQSVLLCKAKKSENEPDNRVVFHLSDDETSS
ncbi:soluble guanylate cyclase gcy-33-like [Ruditapes philippinarum]|uniref:soluble guanylate cyclase gcy-33-like n=1 Tax=Ruditapes philippinarum TaxID=129788 RepID=UPI00295AA9B3|nr:soluble guanylate cyclase gcy-33-like [Ruditapes philippinarum]